LLIDRQVPVAQKFWLKSNQVCNLIDSLTTMVLLAIITQIDSVKKARLSLYLSFN
jgi:hypothetical protein